VGFLKKVTGREGKVVYDALFGDQDLRKARDRLVAGDIAFFDPFLDSRPDEWFVHRLFSGERTGIPIGVLERWAQERPSGRSLSWLGSAQIQAAWAIRGTSLAADVKEEAWEGFHGGLRKAEATLRHATQVAPDLADPWVGLLTTSRGLSMGQEELENRFEEVHKRSPFRPDACDVMLQGLCAKWGGSDERMFEFARWVEANAPVGSASAVHLPNAHYEYSFNQDEEQATYYRSEPVVAELSAAAARFLNATHSPAPPVLLPALNMYLRTLIPVGPESARIIEACIERIADRPTSTPWHRSNRSIGECYQEIRDHRLRQAKEF